MISGPSQERRQIPRIRGRYFVRCRLFSPEEMKLDLNEFEAVTADLSEAGVALITSKDIPVGKNVIVKFSVNNEMGNTLSSYRKVVAFTGTLVHKTPIENNSYRLGIYFGPPDPQDEDKFVNVICSPVFSWPERNLSAGLAGHSRSYGGE